MKKLSLTAIIVAMLSTGFALQTKAQNKTVNIETLSTENMVGSVPAILSEMPVYNKSGKLMYTVKRYEGSSLPKEVSRLVRNQYDDFDIIGVEEVVVPSNEKSIYLVHIGNDKELKTIRVYDGETQIVNEYKKG